MRLHRILVVAALASAALVPTSSADARTPSGLARGGDILATAVGAVTTSDPVGDNGAGLDPRGDITSQSITYDGTTITVSVTVAQFDDMDTSGNWLLYDTGIAFDISSYNSSSDATIYIFNDGVSAVALIDESDCSGTFDQDAATRSYWVSIGASCIDSPRGVWLDTGFTYETASTNSDDSVLSTRYAWAPAPDGYWMVDAGGTVYAFGDVQHLGNFTPNSGEVVVAMTALPCGCGYAVLDSGGKHTRFTASGSENGQVSTASWAAGEDASSIAIHPDGSSYWIFTNRGRVHVAYAAVNYGDMTGTPLNGGVVGAVVTPTGKGYYMVGSDGGIFSFGDAAFAGSMGGQPLNKPVKGLVPDPDGIGYWLVSSDGGVFAFSAPFVGSMGGTALNKPVRGMIPYGTGYLMVGEDGGIFNFAGRPFRGSLGSNPPAWPVVAVAAA